MKKILKMFLALALMFTMVACNASGQGTYAKGTYTGTAKGNNGDVTVEVVSASAEFDIRTDRGIFQTLVNDRGVCGKYALTHMQRSATFLIFTSKESYF